MKKIGEGYFYVVYDLGNGRVLKKTKTPFRFFWYIFIVNKGMPWTWKEYRGARRNVVTIKNTYKELRKKFQTLELFGNPTFLDGIEYEQDKAVVFRDVFKVSSEEEIKTLLKKYIASIHELWKHGVHECVFNFSINNGINDKGDSVFIDFNELSFLKQDALRDIRNTIWTKRWAFWCLSPNFQRWYKEEMAAALTEKNLNRLWESIIR